MKALTSRVRFDEQRRFTAVQEEMGRVRLDADANEQARLVRSDARRRSGDIAEGSPDDGFLICRTHLLAPINGLQGWSGVPLPEEDQRFIRPELTLTRRDPETLPHVVRSRGHTEVRHRLSEAVDLFDLALPPYGNGPASYRASALVLPIRFIRPPTDDEVVRIRLLLLNARNQVRIVSVELDGLPGLQPEFGGEQLTDQWMRLRVPASELDGLRDVDPETGADRLLIRGWGLRGLPPRAEVLFDALEAEDTNLPEQDFVIRGGDGTVAGAGRIYVHGWRSFIEADWRYSRQPHLPSPQPISAPADTANTEQLVYLDLWERAVHGFQDGYLREPALDGEDTSFRTQKVSQVRVVEVERGAYPAQALSATGDGLLSTNVPSGTFPDRYPPEQPDPCRDRCLYTENASTGEGYLGSDNIHVRVEIIRSGSDPIVAWSRNNAATVAPLTRDGAVGAGSVEVSPEHAERFQAGDLVVIEDEYSRLDPQRFPPLLRQLRAVDTAMGRLEFQPDGAVLQEDQQPRPLPVGGALERLFTQQSKAAVRRWDSADWLLTDVRYNLADGINFAFAGGDFRVSEYWTFTARVTHPDGAAVGVVETLRRSPVHGPWHERVPLARIFWDEDGPRYQDLRRLFMPLHEVRDRLIELGRRHLTPGAFTVVVGDGVRTFGDLDQNIAEGVTGDEVLQAALDRLGTGGGTIYIRAGNYKLEHPVLIQGRSRINIIGDHEATELEVTGAGGAFYLDWCGADGQVTIAKLRLIENPELETPIGAGGLVGEVAVSGAVVRDAAADTALKPDDLQTVGSSIAGLLDQLGSHIAALSYGFGRAAASVVKTLAELRQLQRLHPGQPLETVAPDQLAVLRRLPHGVVTLSDCSQVVLDQLDLISRETPEGEGGVAAAVLITGQCKHLSVRDCDMKAPSGVLAAAYGRYLSPSAFVIRPRAGLMLKHLKVSGNRIRPLNRHTATVGVRVDDGELLDVEVCDNKVSGFPQGILIEDLAEPRQDDDVFRILISNNRVSSGEVGIRAIGDEVDIIGNEILLEDSVAVLRAGVQLAGRAHRLQQCAISLPARSSPHPFGIEAAVLVGSGGDFGGLVARSSGDIEIAGNRLEGAGGNGQGMGLLIGGTQPIYGVRIHDNTVLNMGDAAIRAWGDAGAVGGLKIQDNRIEAVALGYPGWDSRNLAALRQLVADNVSGLTDNLDPRAVLERLLSVTGNVRPALDAVLRWLESATVRGGIVLSLVEESEVQDNSVSKVGNPDLPSALAQLQLPMRTAGIAVVGGHDLSIRNNDIARVQGGYRSLQVPVPGPVVRPPIYDFLTPLGVRGVSVPSVRDTQGAVVALRSQMMEYAEGDARKRQRLGGKIYGAMEALEAALEERGSEGVRLARELSDANAAMRDAQGLSEHTLAANQSRAVLSDAASLTAEDEKVAAAWALASRFDHALLADRETIVNVASEIAEQAGELTRGLEGLPIDLAQSAEAVIATPTGKTARLRLARELGTLAAAQARMTAFAKAVPEGGLTREDSTVLTGMVELMSRRLDGLDVTALNEKEIAGLAEANNALVKNLKTSHSEFAERLRQDFEVVEKSSGTPSAKQVEQLQGTLNDILTYARNPEEGTQVRSADLEVQDTRFEAELVILSAEQLDRRIGGLAVDQQSSSTRELRVLSKTASQLANLVSKEPGLVSKARSVERSLEQALKEPDKRAEHQAAARTQLKDLQAEQGRLAGAKLSIAQPVIQKTDVATAQQLAGMGQLLIELHGEREQASLSEGVELFDNHVHQATESLELKPSEREGLLRPLPAATKALGDGRSSSAVRGQALHTLAEILDRLAQFAAERSNASSQDIAVRVLSHALQLLFDPVPSEGDRLKGMHRWVSENRSSLSSSVSSAMVKTNNLSAALEAVGKGLQGITKVRPKPPTGQAGPVRIEAFPADGLFVAGCQGRLVLSGNRTESTRLGATVVGHDDHAMAMPLDEPQLLLKVDTNRITSAAVSALALRPAGQCVVDVRDNELYGCAGAADPQGQTGGAAVVAVAGSGVLEFSGNRLHDNGTERKGLLHEVSLQWQGDISATGNHLRHAGGSEGGCGLLITPSALDGSLIEKLSTLPALEVEQPPETGQPEKPDIPTKTPTTTADLGTLLVDKAATLNVGNSFSFGAIKLAALQPQTSYRRQEIGPRSKPSTGLAHANAESWLGLNRITRVDPVIDFLDRRPPVLLPPRPVPPQRSVHVVSNDIVANGPALLLLGDANSLIAATVVANELESLADNGAAYLRQVDTTVFANNRCECLGEVNVVVVRSGEAQVSVTGNAVIGAEPPVPPALPLPPPTKPGRPIPIPGDIGLGTKLPDSGITRPTPKPGGIQLAIDIGTGTEVKIPLNEDAIRKALEDTRDRGFSRAADDAEAQFTNFASKTKWSPNQDATDYFKTVTATDRLGVVTEDSTYRLATKAELEPAPTTRTSEELRIGDQEADTNLVAADLTAEPSRTLSGQPMRTLSAADTAKETAAIDSFNLFLADSALAPATKLYGVYRATGKSELEAKNSVKVHLAASGGDEEAALVDGLRTVTGIETTKPTVKEQIKRPSLLEEMVSVAIAKPDILEVAPDILLPLPIPLEPPPDPRDHSLVIIGGSRVGAINNVTSAGVHVHNADQSIENNL